MSWGKEVCERGVVVFVLGVRRGVVCGMRGGGRILPKMLGGMIVFTGLVVGKFINGKGEFCNITGVPRK